MEPYQCKPIRACSEPQFGQLTDKRDMWSRTAAWGHEGRFPAAKAERPQWSGEATFAGHPSMGETRRKRTSLHSGGLVLQPELRRSSPFPMALAGSLLMAAAPARPEAGGLAVRRLGPDQVPEQTAHFRHGERQQIGVEIDHAFFPRPQRGGARRDRHAPASPG